MHKKYPIKKNNEEKKNNKKLIYSKLTYIHYPYFR